MYNNSISSIDNLPPKHRFLQKFTNEVKTNHLQPDFNVPKNIEGASQIQKPGSNLSSRTIPPPLNLRQLFNNSLELTVRKQKENITPRTPSDDASTDSNSSGSAGANVSSYRPMRIAPRRVQTPTPRIPLPSYQFNGGSAPHYGVQIRYPAVGQQKAVQDDQQQQPAQQAAPPAEPVVPVKKVTPAAQKVSVPTTSSQKSKKKSNKVPTQRKLKNLTASSAGDSSSTSAAPPADEQPHCCIKGCRKPVHNRLRHSLKVYTVEDCDPEFIAKNWQRVCSFHYFRDNYLNRKQVSAKNGTKTNEVGATGKRKRSGDDEGPALKKRAGNHDEAQ